ncbi:F-box only protein 7 isoform X2 [Aplysia californica]|uniref:F-box only protein 7 isoform X2 n=1 Tax=Aplysia californica TaxID=6500 RepID=A0ABM0JQ25_APLCA|nr:F-box only protein 7 isoform X2 [Aplysia californica]
MKLKVKWDHQSRVVDLGDRGVAVVTLGELKQIVASEFQAEDQDFQLSLNKRDALQGEDQVLLEFGMVSGDLVHVIGASVPEAAIEAAAITRQQPVDSRTSSSSSQAFFSASTEGSAASSASPSAASQSLEVEGGSSDLSHRESEMDFSEADDVEKELLQAKIGQAEINRYLKEPLVVRESTGSQVPISLSQLYQSAGCTLSTDALWVAVHCLMLESGFTCRQSPVNTGSMPDNWKRPGYYRCEYTYQVATDVSAPCSVTGVTLGSTIAVNGVAQTESGFNTETFHLTSSHFVRGLSSDVPTVFRALDKLSLVIKDKICLPLTNEVVTAAGYRERQGLLALPWEVQLRVLSCLDARSLCRLGQTCHELCTVYKDKIIWRRLHLMHFGEPTNSSLSQDWFQLYRDNFITRKRREEEIRRHQHLIDPMWPHTGLIGSRPFAPLAPFPHVIGGDYDLNPEFASGIHHPMGRLAHGQRGPGIPSGPNVDPFSPLVGRDALPGRPLGGRSNMTGSPFASSNRRFF